VRHDISDGLVEETFIWRENNGNPTLSRRNSSMQARSPSALTVCMDGAFRTIKRHGDRIPIVEG